MSIQHDDGVIISLDHWKRSKAGPKGKTCHHPRTVIDERGGTVECRDCGTFLSAFQVLLQCARQESAWSRRLAGLRREAAELQRWTPFLRSMKEIERVWRGRKLLPVCPHCRRGLWPTELTGARHSVEYEAQQRRRAGVALPLFYSEPPPAPELAP